MGKRSTASVSAADANRNFSKLLRAVREGRSVVITSHGQPVAKIVPFERDGRVASHAKRVLLTHLRQQPVVDVGRWTRESLYKKER